MKNKAIDFNWDIIDVVIGGKSAIDLSKLSIKTNEDAEQFLNIYGYDLNQQYIIDEVNQIFTEAIEFIEKILLPDPVTRQVIIKIPEEIKRLSDPRKLILIASEPSDNLQSWACAILKIMHTISHINNDLSSKYFPEIQKQIIGKIFSAIYENSDNEKFFGKDESGIKIYDIEVKTQKERNSILTKLLHKVENVAADVFDQIGLRIITYDKFDALQVVSYLKKNGILNFCNVKPSRSINTLIDLKTFQKIAAYNKKKLESGEIDYTQYEANLRIGCETDAAITFNPNNPHSSSDYRAIQFTGRRMIRINNDLLSPLSDSNKKDICFFFPYEIQLMDLKTYHDNKSGKASYDDYKTKQLITVRKRILGNLLS
jgi:uncharacterized protein (TIGR04562 family)